LKRKAKDGMHVTNHDRHNRKGLLQKYKELKELSYNIEAWITVAVANQSNDRRPKEEEYSKNKCFINSIIVK